MAESHLTFEKAFELSVALESANNDAKNLRSPLKTKSTTAINRVDTCPVHTQKPFYGCGAKRKADNCRFKTAECWKCHKKGHRARACKSKSSTNPDPRPPLKKDTCTTCATNILAEEGDYSMYTMLLALLLNP